jgi:hypothetical protein
MNNNNNIIGKKKRATFYRTASQKNKLHGNYKLRKIAEMIINNNPTNEKQNMINQSYQQPSNKTYSQYLINNFNYLLKQNTRHKTNYKLSVAPHLSKILLEKLHSGVPVGQLRASKDDVYKNETIDPNQTYLNEYMFRDENNN